MEDCLRKPYDQVLDVLQSGRPGSSSSASRQNRRHDRSTSRRRARRLHQVQSARALRPAESRAAEGSSGRGFYFTPGGSASERFVGDFVGKGMRGVKRSRKSNVPGGRPLRQDPRSCAGVLRGSLIRRCVPLSLTLVGARSAALCRANDAPLQALAGAGGVAKGAADRRDIRVTPQARSGRADSRQGASRWQRSGTRTRCRSPRWRSKSRSAHTRCSLAAATAT